MGYERQQQRQSPQGAPMARTELATMTGAYRAPSEVNTALERVADRCHLLSPASSVGSIPEGCEVVLTSVHVDIDNDTYAPKGGGGLALKKTAIDQIGKALGVSWLPRECYRVDDGSAPYYCHYRVAGMYRSFDGQQAVITGEKIMDLRNGSPMALGMKEAELSMARSHILSHAESKAKNRAIRSTGLRQSYSREELAKPFIAARLMFTGRTDDPELKCEFASQMAKSFTDSSATLYGPAPSALPAEHKASPPPPVGSINDDDDAIPTHGEATCGAKPAASGGGSGQSGHTVTIGGREVPIEEAPITILQDNIARVSEDLATGVVPDDDVKAAREWRAALIAQVEKRGQY